jgi:tRNA (guanine37-N1)-methyltransferase
VLVEAVVRLLPGFMGNPESPLDDSFSTGRLEAPAYTRPSSWRGLDVPEVLRSGDHKAVAAWRAAESERLTRERRPDLFG